MTQPRRKKPIDVRLLLLVGAAVTIPILSRVIEDRFYAVKVLELLVYDSRMRGLPQIRHDRDIVVVGMDDRSVDSLFRRGLIDRPAYSRSMHARVLREIHAAGARTVAFDVYFTGDAPPRETRVFAEALRDCGGAITALKSEDAPDSSSSDSTLRFTEPVPDLRPYTRAGSITFPPTAGRVVRWFDPWPSDRTADKRYLHLTVLAASDFLGQAGQEPYERADFRLGSIRAPFIDLDRNVGIRFIGPREKFVPNPDAPPNTLRESYLPYEQVYTGEWKNRDPAFFRGKLVLVGRISALEDRVLTPQGDMQGVELHANTIQTLLQHNWIHRWTYAENYLLMLALCLGVALTFWRLNLLWAAAAAGLVSVVWYIVCGLLFSAGTWADTVDPIIAVWLTFGSASAIEAWKTRGVFKRFVPSQVADDILRAPDAATTEREVAIAFCDIRSYTVLSERLAPEQAEALLHAYFQAGEAAADRFGGVLDKFVGDEMMLYFEPKRGREPHALRAVRWALAMQARANTIDSSGAAGETGFKIGIGIAAGPVRFGRVKARQRLQHTVIGDSVNLASRLQSATKDLHAGILLSGPAYDQIADRIEAERLPDLSVKGKQEPQVVYAPKAVLE